MFKVDKMLQDLKLEVNAGINQDFMGVNQNFQYQNVNTGTNNTQKSRNLVFAELNNHL